MAAYLLEVGEEDGKAVFNDKRHFVCLPGRFGAANIRRYEGDLYRITFYLTAEIDGAHYTTDPQAGAGWRYVADPDLLCRWMVGLVTDEDVQVAAAEVAAEKSELARLWDLVEEKETYQANARALYVPLLVDAKTEREALSQELAGLRDQHERMMQAASARIADMEMELQFSQIRLVIANGISMSLSTEKEKFRRDRADMREYLIRLREAFVSRPVWWRFWAVRRWWQAVLRVVSEVNDKS